jgi:hypothetical protein
VKRQCLHHAIEVVGKVPGGMRKVYWGEPLLRRNLSELGVSRNR